MQPKYDLSDGRQVFVWRVVKLTNTGLDLWSFFSISNLGFLDFAEKTSVCQFFRDRFQFLFSVKFLMFCSCSFSNVLPTFFDVQVSGPDFSSKFPRWLLKLLRNCSSYWYIYWYFPQSSFCAGGVRSYEKPK